MSNMPYGTGDGRVTRDQLPYDNAAKYCGSPVV